MCELDPIRVNYVREFIKLSLWYVDKMVRDEGMSFADAVNKHVNIYRYTSFYDGEHNPATSDVGPPWQAMLGRLECIYDSHRSESTTASFEEKALSFLWPYLEERIRTVGNPIDALRRHDRPYECWTCDDREGELNIHVENVYQPRSPLSEMIVPFAASLVRMLRDSRARRPGIEIVRCSTWLNTEPRFQSIFPRCWVANASPRLEVRHTYGYWGQFTDRRGDFHARNGEILRETGDFAFPCTVCTSPLQDILDHLERHFHEAVRYNAERGFESP